MNPDFVARNRQAADIYKVMVKEHMKGLVGKPHLDMLQTLFHTLPDQVHFPEKSSQFLHTCRWES